MKQLVLRAGRHFTTAACYTIGEANLKSGGRMVDNLKCSDEEIVRRAEGIYERQIRPKVEVGNKGKIVVVDVATSDYELGDDAIELARRLQARNPAAVPSALRVGFPALGKLGGSWAASKP
jgi:hypothetical protein